MEHSEEMALEGATQKPLFLLRLLYVYNTAVTWPHGPRKLSHFLDHLNSAHDNIQFTMEMVRDGYFTFPDVDICHQTDESLGHKSYRNPMHIVSTLPTNRP
jgi:hypothetical protein